MPDLFVVAGAHSVSQGLFLYRWKATAPSGAPVFAQPVMIPHSGGGVKLFHDCTIYQDGAVIRGLFLVKADLINAVFDRAKHEFIEQSRITLDTLPRAAGAVGLLPNAQGGVSLLFHVSDGTPGHPTGPGSRDRDNSYVPYDGAGIWRGGLPYFGFYLARRPDLSSGPLGAATPILSPRQALLSSRRLSVANLGRGHEHDIIAGSRFGDMYYYHNRSAGGAELDERRHAVGEDGIVLRHPTIGNTPIAYPNPRSGLSDILSGGEGAVYWYRFTGRFHSGGRPIFAAPTPVLEDGALLYAGTLPVPTVVDWDGDGVQDIVAGNSEGRIIYFRNRGTNDQPAFDTGVALRAGGREILVQPGYKGDIQGPGEARWGYVSTNVIDWNGDGLPDILMGDSLSRHMVFVDRGTRTQPRLDPERPLYLDGLDLHGTWRVRPGAAKLGAKMAYVALDDEDQFHLYWRLDTFNLADGGKLRMEDGSFITANFIGAGGTGRSKIELVDWDQDGVVDMLVGTPRHHSIPNPRTGLPRVLGLPGATVLFLKNVGTNSDPKFRFPVIFRHNGQNIYLGQHEVGVSAGRLGGGGLNLLVSREDGRLFLYQREHLAWTAPQ
ncbi:MAG: VCBS repeat-containing protein [Acidobacteria bacterium]|nr:VCBS repeat-containing protein [Acidobacteriota bacterium]